MLGDAQKDVDSREQSEARFLTALSRRIFPCSPHMTTLDPGSAGFHWDSPAVGCRIMRWKLLSIALFAVCTMLGLNDIYVLGF